MNGKKFTLGLAVLTLGCGLSFAQESTLASGLENTTKWHSLFGSTHRKLAKEAMKRIDKNVYPDIERMADQLREGAYSESGHQNFWKDNGGFPKDLWGKGDKKNSGGVLGNYEAFKTQEAYKNIGRICHLTQDQAVPAHAANIQHLTSEGMEAWADWDFQLGQVPEIDPSKQPYEYYQDQQDDTRSRLSTWVNPVTGVPYWVAPMTAKSGEDVTMGTRGAYGGGKDTYSEWIDDNNNNFEGNSNNRKLVTKMPEICSERLGTSVGYTKAVMIAASNRLPPLVKDIKVVPNVVLPGGKADIFFTAMDNKSRSVKYTITITGPAGTETLTEGEIPLNKPMPISYNNNNYSNNNQPETTAENFMFYRGNKAAWNGTIGGKPLAEGAYTIEVQLTDEDGNMVPEDVNTDSVRDNDTKIALNVVNVAPKALADISVSFDTPLGR